MHFILALWIFLLVNTAVVMTNAKPPKRGQVIKATSKALYPRFYDAIVLGFIQSWDEGMAIKTARISLKTDAPPDRGVKFNKFFRKEVKYKDRNGQWITLGGEIDLQFHYALSHVFHLLEPKIILKKEGVDNLEEEMDAALMEQIKSLDKGQLIKASTRAMYGEKADFLSDFAIFLGCIPSSGGLSVKVAAFSGNLPKSVPRECRADFAEYFTKTYMRSKGTGKDFLVHGQIDLRPHIVGPTDISIPAEKVKLITKQVDNLEKAIFQSLKKGQVIMHEEKIPFDFAIFLDFVQLPEGSIVKIAHFSDKLPKSVPAICRAAFNTCFNTDSSMCSKSEISGVPPYTFLAEGSPKSFPLSGDIDLGSYIVKPESISTAGDTIRLMPGQVHELEGRIALMQRVCGKAPHQSLIRDQ